VPTWVWKKKKVYRMIPVCATSRTQHVHYSIVVRYNVALCDLVRPCSSMELDCEVLFIRTHTNVMMMTEKIIII